MGAYDAAAENTPAQRKADEMQQTYNLAKQVQFERQGEQALAQLTPKQLEAVETLVQTPATGTSVMSAGVARENARDQAYSVLLEGGYSYKTISDLVTWRSRQQDKEAYQKTVQWHEDLADSGVLGGAAATVLSVPENLLSGVGAIDVALQKANQTGGEERPVNYYSAPMRLYGGANAARETVGQKLERNTDATIFGQNVASTAYGIGTSMLDSGATAALAAIGVPPVVGSSLLGGAAATGAMVDAKDRGVDDTHALWTGVFAGVAETLFEDVSLEKLLKLDVPQGTLRQRMQTTLKNTLLQAGTEGSEELFTDFANYITDRAINGGLSEYDTAVRAYMDQGLSQKEASQKAGADLAARMALDFVAGGVAGGLMAGEMLDQVLFTQLDSGREISNIVLMGIGEPLDNRENVLRFLRLVNHPDGLNIGMRHISLSTCGVVPGIDALAEEDLQLTLSVSLHAPDSETRSRIMPVNRAWDVEELFAACHRYFRRTGRRISFEYAMIDGVNDHDWQADLIARRIAGMPGHVNLIPLNDVVESPFKPSRRIAAFQKRLESHGITATVRRSLGGDIDASCGQLRRRAMEERKGEDPE